MKLINLKTSEEVTIRTDFDQSVTTAQKLQLALAVVNPAEFIFKATYDPEYKTWNVGTLFHTVVTGGESEGNLYARLKKAGYEVFF